LAKSILLSDKTYDKIYIETTAAIDAAFKSFPEVIAIIKSSNQKATSQYVKMEIRKGFLNSLVLLHNKIPQFQSVTELHQYTANISSSPKRYYLAAILDALTQFWKQIEEDRPQPLIDEHGDISAKILLVNLKSFLRLWIRRFFRKVDSMVDEILNPMNCFVDLDIPQEKDGLFINKPVKCSDSKHECGIKNYFANNMRVFNNIHERLQAVPGEERDAETKKRISSLKKILKSVLYNRPFSNLDQNADLCWACSDAIHAVMALPDRAVVNRNEKHFLPICEALNSRSISYKSPSSGQ
jgi:hypothetical protein